jgi:carbonic anhydrase
MDSENPMPALDELLEGNRRWAENLKESDPQFFERLSEIQTPELLWIGCSDSRITPSSSVGLLPGEMFVHRNVANLVNHTDMNCLSVLQFAVDVLKVRHVIVCGHYGCGGVRAALEDQRLGLIDNWLLHIHDLIFKHRDELNVIDDPEAKVGRLCEINVIEQVVSVGETTVIRDAWERGQDVSVHGWIYTIADGIYRDMQCTLANADQLGVLRAKTFSGLKSFGTGI